MREITQDQFSFISGGVNCLDTNTWVKMQDRAFNDAITFSIVVTTLSMAALYGVSASILGTAALGVVLFPYAAAYGYASSGTWNILYS